MPDTTILAETQAFIAKQREALHQQREGILNQQRDLQRQLDEVDQMLRRFATFEGKPATRSAAGHRGPRRARQGSRREELLMLIREGKGLTRGQLLEKMGLKGNKSGEMSVSNALTALTKGNQVVRREGKYVVG